MAVAMVCRRSAVPAGSYGTTAAALSRCIPVKPLPAAVGNDCGVVVHESHYASGCRGGILLQNINFPASTS